MFKEEIERIDISLGVLLLKLTSNQNLWCLCSRRCTPIINEYFWVNISETNRCEYFEFVSFVCSSNIWGHIVRSSARE